MYYASNLDSHVDLKFIGVRTYQYVDQGGHMYMLGTAAQHDLR